MTRARLQLMATVFQNGQVLVSDDESRKKKGIFVTSSAELYAP